MMLLKHYSKNSYGSKNNSGTELKLSELKKDKFGHGTYGNETPRVLLNTKKLQGTFKLTLIYFSTLTLTLAPNLNPCSSLSFISLNFPCGVHNIGTLSFLFCLLLCSSLRCLVRPQLTHHFNIKRSIGCVIIVMQLGNNKGKTSSSQFL